MVKTRIRVCWVVLSLLVLEAAGAEERGTLACALALHQLAFDVPRALRMADASAWLPEGLLAGQIVFLGRYDECLTTEGARYCLASLCLGRPGADGRVPCPKPASTTTEQMGNFAKLAKNGTAAALRFGLCLPADCAGEELPQVVVANGSALPLPPSLRQRLPLGLRLNVSRSVCRGAGDPPRSRLEAADWTVAAALVVMLLAAYVGRRVLQREELVQGPKASLQPVVRSDPPAALPVLDAIRVLSTATVVICHRFYTQPNYVISDGIMHLKTYDTLPALPLKLGVYSVDNYFLLSGLLVTYVYLNRDRDKKPTPWIVFYLNRLARLYPSLIAILLVGRILPLLEAGPVWWEFTRCDFSWASQLLFYSNYESKATPCVGRLWYLSADTQMYFVAPLALLALRRRPRPALRALALLIVAGVVLRFCIAYWQDVQLIYPILENGRISDWQDSYRRIYIPSYTRYPPFVLGMMLGYNLHTTRHERKTQALPRGTVIRLWAAICLLLAAIVLPLPGLSSSTRSRRPLVESLYLAASHTAWALALAAFILLVVRGRAGPVARFMSDPRWRPLSRLSFAIYLVHMPLQQAQLASQRQPLYIGYRYTLLLGIADFVLSIPVAALLHKLCEQPVQHLQQLLFQKTASDRRKNTHIYFQA